MPSTANCLELTGNYSWGFTSKADKGKKKDKVEKEQKGKAVKVDN